MKILSRMIKNIIIYTTVSVATCLGVELIVATYLNLSSDRLLYQIRRTGDLVESLCLASGGNKYSTKYLEINTDNQCNH